MRACSSLLLLLSNLSFAAEPVDWILTAGQVLTMDAQRRVIPRGAVAVRGQRIVAAGPAAGIIRDYTAKARLDRPGAILMPGLVNTHTHAPMSLLRGIADDLRLQEWLEKYIFPAEARSVSREFVRLGTELACLEMMLSGTTTFTDMYYFEETVAEASKACGMRAVLGQTIIGFPAPDYKTPADALAGTAKFIQRFKGDPLITPAPAPHAIYTNSAETLRAARALANKYGMPLIIHVSETEKENQDALKAHQMSPTRYLDSLGALAGRTIFAHTVWTDAADWAIMARTHTGAAHCPTSNMKLASGIAPVAAMRAAGVALGLGPDGPAGSNNDFNLFEEMHLAALLSKVSTRDPQSLPARTVVEMATIEGARALGLDQQTGSLEPGKRADLITVSMDAPHAVPTHDPYSLLVYTLKGADVRDVMIDGRLTVSDRQARTLDAASILTRAAQFRARIDALLKQ
jgi:5-methylthioadenosine/S-adenosylhomocysteine deaminase